MDIFYELRPYIFLLYNSCCHKVINNNIVNNILPLISACSVVYCAIVSLFHSSIFDTHFVLFYFIRFLATSVSPKIKPFTFGDTPVFAGQSAQVTCSILEGDAPLEFSWTFNGPQDVFGLGVSVMRIGAKTSLLSIDSTNSVHRGDYTCYVTNRAGKASYSAGLNVHGTQKNKS